jgi:amino acid adenylation domain-containing protein
MKEIQIPDPLVLSGVSSAGCEPESADLNNRSADCTSCRRESVTGQRLEEQLQYWRRQLSGLVPLQLPTVKPAVMKQIFFTAKEPIKLSPCLTRAVKKVSESQQATFFMTMLAAFQTLLARYSGQEDIVVGSPVVNRGNAESEPLSELLRNTLVLRTNLRGNPTFCELVQRVRETTLEAYQNQDLPFESLVAALAPRGDPDRIPLFQVVFNLMSPLPSSSSAWELTLDRTEIEDRSVGADLAMNLFEYPEGVHGHLSYNADLFEAETVRRMIDHFLVLLEGIVADPNSRILELPLLGPEERKRLLVDWNDTQRDYPRDTFLHQFVERQVEVSPNTVALVFENRILTYRQLNQRANRLAHHLRKRGVGPDRIVGILAERSIEMWIGILATLKAGGAYLPLEASYPLERLAFILQDAKPSILLSQRHLAAKLPTELGEPVLLEQDFAFESEANPTSGVRAENLAYIIYTSGSTGKPKGALNSHGGLSNWLCWMQEIFSMSGEDAMLQKSPFSFDVSVREFFLPLSTGGKVIIARPGLQGDSRYLVEVIRKHAITAIHFVPPMLSAFLADPDVKSCTSLRLVICSGDALTFEVRDRFFAVFPRLDLHNMWGATEHAPESSYYRCGHEPGKGIVPVGRPGANTQLYILDRMMQPVPIGVVGEAYLGGIQTGLGYLARPELTAEKFLTSPFTDGKLYKTGDLARFRSDGVMEFVGRADGQVKLRGFRVELGEIEAVLKTHPVVRDCVVVVHGRTDDASKRLVAYLVAEKINTEELRQHARKTLPEYMVPATFIFLEGIPVTDNGKIDRTRLSEPERVKRAQFVEPQTPLQKRLAEIWCKVLGVERVGLKDDFFELGGDSLLAGRIIAEIRRAFGRRFPLAALFQAPTVGGLAATLQAQDGNLCWSPLVPIQPYGSRPPFFAVHGLSGEVMFYRELAQRLGSDQPLYGIQSEGLDGGPIKHRSMQTIARYYIDEIRHIQPEGPYYLGGYSIGGLIAFEMAQQLRAAGDEVACLVLLDPDPPPRRGTLAKRVRLTLDEAALLLPGKKLHYFVRRIAQKAKREVVQLQTTGSDFIRALYRTLSYASETTAERLEPIRSPTGKMLVRARRKYVPRTYPGRMILFLTAVSEESDLAPDRSWSHLAESGVEIHQIPGEHLTIFDARYVPAIVDKLETCFRDAQVTPSRFCQSDLRR